MNDKDLFHKLAPYFLSYDKVLDKNWDCYELPYVAFESIVVEMVESETSLPKILRDLSVMLNHEMESIFSENAASSGVGYIVRDIISVIGYVDKNNNSIADKLNLTNSTKITWNKYVSSLPDIEEKMMYKFKVN